MTIGIDWVFGVAAAGFAVVIYLLTRAHALERQALRDDSNRIRDGLMAKMEEAAQNFLRGLASKDRVIARLADRPLPEPPPPDPSLLGGNSQALAPEPSAPFPADPNAPVETGADSLGDVQELFEQFAPPQRPR